MDPLGQLVWSQLVSSSRARASRRRLRTYLDAVGRDGARADRAYCEAVRRLTEIVQRGAMRRGEPGE